MHDNKTTPALGLGASSLWKDKHKQYYNSQDHFPKIALHIDLFSLPFLHLLTKEEKCVPPS